MLSTVTTIKTGKKLYSRKRKKRNIIILSLTFPLCFLAITLQIKFLKRCNHRVCGFFLDTFLCFSVSISSSQL